jgi:hypothetical protein
MLKAAFSQMGVRACVCVYVCSGSTCARGIAHAQSAETVDGNITPVDAYLMIIKALRISYRPGRSMKPLAERNQALGTVRSSHIPRVAPPVLGSARLGRSAEQAVKCEQAVQLRFGWKERNPNIVAATRIRLAG